jgi:hypothetical protein
LALKTIVLKVPTDIADRTIIDDANYVPVVGAVLAPGGSLKVNGPPLRMVMAPK